MKDIKDMTADELEEYFEKEYPDNNGVEEHDQVYDSETQIPVKKEEDKGNQEPEKKEEDTKSEDQKTEEEAKKKLEAEEEAKAKENEKTSEDKDQKEDDKDQKEEKSEEQKKIDDAMAKMRIENKKLKEEKERIEREAKETIEKAKKAEQSNLPTPDQCFEYLVDAIIDKNNTTEKAAKNAILKGLSSIEINSVIEKAENGSFGDKSEDILELAEEYLPRVIVRENAQKVENNNIQIEQKKEQDDFTNKYNQELNQIIKEYPDLSKDDSEMAKSFSIWQKKYIGTYDQSGNRTESGILSDDNAALLITKPLMMVKMFSETFNQQSNNSELTALQKENAEYKKRLNIVDAPEGSTATLKNGKSNKDLSADELLKKLEEMSEAA